MDGTLALALGPLLAVPLLALGQVERDVAPVDPDARLPRAVRESLAAIDPAVVDWGTEALNESASAALHELDHALEGGDMGGVSAVATPGFNSLPLARGGWETVGAFEVSDLADGGEAAGLAAVLESLRVAAGGGSLRSTSKVVSVRLVGTRAVTDLRFELVRQASPVTQLTARFVGTWDTRDPDAPRLAALGMVDGVVTRAPAALFTDVTAAALAGPHLDEQLALGLDHWRDRIDTRVGVGILGHHGVAVGDVDGDGLDDLYLCQPGGLPNRLFLRKPDGTTREVAAAAGVDVLDSTQSALILDLDGDGARELVLAVSDRLAVFRNDGRGVFRGAALVDTMGATSLAAADVDRDGDVDLFVCGYDSPYEGGGTPEPYYDAENGQRNYLFRNDGGLRFMDVTLESGLTHRRYSFAAAFEDVDDDGDQDLYVANDFGRNNLYMSDGAGGFVDQAAAWGVEDLSAGMGVSFADVDGDGRMDLHVGNMFSAAGNRVAYQRRFKPDADGDVRAGYQRHARGNSLFLNQGDGFVDVSEQAGVTMGRWAWGALLIDLENDGAPDVYVPNGFVTGAREDDL